MAPKTKTKIDISMWRKYIGRKYRTGLGERERGTPIGVNLGTGWEPRTRGGGDIKAGLEDYQDRERLIFQYGDEGLL